MSVILADLAQAGVATQHTLPPLTREEAGACVHYASEQIDHFCTQRDVLDLYDSATHKRLQDLTA